MLSDDVAEPVWYWLRGPDHVLEGLLAPDASGEAVGLAHVRAWPHPLKGRTMGLLDDLYVTPAVRSSGAADVLFEALAERGRDRGWPRIRLLTQEFNYRGRALYDRYMGAKSDFII